MGHLERDWARTKQGVLMKLKALLFAALSSLMLCDCVHLGCFSGCSTHTHNSSSLVEFLYPHGSLPPEENAIPQLRIPLRVGWAFFPTRQPDALGPLHASRRQ